MENSKIISLRIEDQIFNVKKSILCEHSDYFTAMFSGNYVENEQQEIFIDVVDANSMNLIIHYMENGLIDLLEYPLSTIGDLASAANFFQITELIKQIEYCLDLQLSHSNWIETMDIAEKSSYSKLEQLCAAYGLLSFKSMKPQHIPSVHKLCWYLSHPYLDTDNELDVFKFGYQWISNMEIGADALLLIIGCLDIASLTNEDLKECKILIKDYENSLAMKVIDCLLEISNIEKISEINISKKKTELCIKYTERVYSEIMCIVKESRKRKLKYTPTVPVWVVKDCKFVVVPHNMYTYDTERGFEKWLEVAEQNLWGWSVTTWGANKLIVSCGEHGRGTGIFMRDVKEYDTFRNEWTCHGVQLPQRRHGGVTVSGDSLYLIGGVGGFRVILDTAVVYDLKQRTFQKIAKLPDTIQNPAVCTHEDRVYASGQKNIYRYENLGDSDLWVTAVATEIRVNCMVSFKKYIYCTQSYFSNMYRFKPDLENRAELEIITCFSSPTAGICNLGDHLMAFTRTVGGLSESLSVEVCEGKSSDEKPRVLWTETDSNIKINEVAGACAIVMNKPPVGNDMSSYVKQCLSRYSDHSQ